MKKIFYLIFICLSANLFSMLEFTIKNPVKNTYSSAYVKAPLEFKNIEEIEIVDENGKVILYQFEKDFKMNVYNLWIFDDFPADTEKRYKVFNRKSKMEKKIGIKREKDFIEVENNYTGIRIPLKVYKNDGPIKEIMVNRKWIGESFWKEEIESYNLEILCEGPLFFKSRQIYGFKEGSFSEILITFFSEKPYIIVEEIHKNNEKNYWELNLWKRWKIEEGYIQGWFTTEAENVGSSPHPPVIQNSKFTAPFLYEKLRKVVIPSSFRLGDTITYLEPRWTQNCEKSWFFGFSDGEYFVGIIPAKAGKWIYPYSNSIEVKVNEKKEGKFIFPSFEGSRYYYIIVNDNKNLENLKNFTQYEVLTPLNEILDKYVIEWENKKGNFEPLFYYSDWIANPTNPGTRHKGRNLVSDIRKGKFPSEDINTLSLFQQYIDPDFWGYPYNGWSPLNPNFYTDLVRIPIALLTGLKSHPHYSAFVEHIKKLLDYHLSASIIQPKGAGVECPGYLWHALGVFIDMNDACIHHGIDLTKDERIKSAISFLLRTTQPMGNGKRKILPMGDTHPPGVDFETINEIGLKLGINEDPKNWKTEEFPGFGIVFRNKSGTEKETFFAFKSGPTRGHYHGDQLAFHYCAYNKRIAIDHMCGYAPRADQEHMHNRVFFSLPDWKFANMDGYERVIGFKTSKEVDIGIGQIESKRLRWMPDLPEKIVWQAKYPVKFYQEPIIYRRYVIFIKSEKEDVLDYFIIWDRFELPSDEIIPNYALHIETSNDFIKEKEYFRFDEKLFLFVLSPLLFDFERFNWKFERKRKDGSIYYSEETKGLFIRSSEKNKKEFITLLYPSTNNIPIANFNANERKLKISFKNSSYEINFGKDLLKTNNKSKNLILLIKKDGKEILNLLEEDIDLERSQGQWFYPVLEAGYNFNDEVGFLKKYINFILGEEFYNLKKKIIR
ncbi:MAG: hypothetical protein NC827_01920 [Candidatus Omnitrophica bacterium]|nr:hypothetical protein [Candidatus Omnitrophota bacterium]